MSDTVNGTVSIQLNDFESFNRFLFQNGIENWGRFYSEEEYKFTPPIIFPVKEADFQLNHYALWMVIARFGLSTKPYWNMSGERPFIPKNRCYACEWKRKQGHGEEQCVVYCPLTSVVTDQTSCSKLWDRWNTQKPPYIYHYDYDYNAIAEEIAKIPWREV